MALIDKAQIARRFGRASNSYDAHAHAQHHIHQVLLELLATCAPPQFHKVLEIGCGTAALSQTFAQRFQTASLTLNDLSAQYEPLIRSKMPSETRLIFGDAEQLDFGSGYDLLLSASALQWFANPQAFVTRAAAMLDSDGLFAVSTFTTENLNEIKTLTGIGLSYPDAQAWRSWLSNDFRLLICKQETLTLTFNSPPDVLRHLQQTGVNALGRQRWSKGKLADFSRRYTQQFSRETGVCLTYSPLYLLARRK